MKYSEYLRPVRMAFLIGLAVFLVTGLLWQLGIFQESELWVYDNLVADRSDPKVVDSRFILVLQDEKDIENLDYPLRDKVLSELLEKIESGGPAVVGMDLYRDLPEPRDGSGSASLSQTLLRYPNIISIFLFNTPDQPFLIPPPTVLASDPSRYGFNDFPFDYKTVRRAFLLLPWDKTHNPYESFSLTIAQLYLARENIQLSQDGDQIRVGKTTIRRFLHNDGGYINASDGGYQFLQDFRGPHAFVQGAGRFKSMSVRDTLKLDHPEIFKDKIVLVGASADSSNDKVDTPIDLRAPGIEVHAQIVNQLLRAAIDGTRPTSTFSQCFGWLWTALWCVCGVIIGFFVRSHVLFALTVALVLILIVLSGWLFFVNGYWIIVFCPAVVFVATAMLVKAYAATYEQQQRANLMKLFSQRVPPAIAQEIWDKRDTFLQGGRPAAQRLMVSVLFTDLKNYSTISEGMSPAELIAWVNECQGALTRHVEKNRGMVFCFMGDGMMAVYGAPIPRKTEAEMAGDALNAVQSAVGMAGEIREMNAAWKAQGRPIAGLRVGIFTGEAMGGDLGSNDYLEYSVIGDTVNTASRLESVDKEGAMTGGEEECRILIGAMTYRFIKDKFTARHVGTINLKGKYQTTDVYQVAIDGTFRPIGATTEAAQLK